MNYFKYFSKNLPMHGMKCTSCNALRVSFSGVKFALSSASNLTSWLLGGLFSNVVESRTDDGKEWEQVQTIHEVHVHAFVFQIFT